MLVFRHPKYYEEMRKRAKQFQKEQAAKLASEQADKQSSSQAGEGGRVGPKATSTQATSDQASSGSRTNKR